MFAGAAGTLAVAASNTADYFGEAVALPAAVVEGARSAEDITAPIRGLLQVAADLADQRHDLGESWDDGAISEVCMACSTGW